LETKFHEVMRPHPKSAHAQIVRTKQVVHIEDLTAMPAYHEGDPVVTALESKEYVGQHPIPVDRGSVVGRTALAGRLVHVPDVLADLEYTHRERQQIVGYRASLGAPLLRKGKVVGGDLPSAKRAAAIYSETDRVGDHLC
jgi:GAF domain-containing protein